MTTFAPHRETLESFVDCINGGVDKDTLTRLLAEDVMLYGPFGDEPITGREAAVETIRTVNGLSSDDTYTEVLSGDTHHAAHFRLQVADAAVNGIFLVLLDADGKIAEVSIFYRTLPAGVASLLGNLPDGHLLPGAEAITGCILSALLSQRCGAPATTGPVSLAACREHWQVLERLGGGAAPLRCGDWSPSAAQLARLRGI